jgi:hypothetical protein
MSIARKVIIIIAALTVAACGKGDKGDKGGKGGTADKGKAAPAAPAWIKVEKLGVQLEAPGDAKANPGAGDSFMIQSDSASDCTVMLSKESPDMMEPFDKVLGQIKDAKMGNGKLKAMKKEEQGADGGWKIEWEAEGSMDPKETTYGVDYRVMIDGAAYGCARKTNTPEGQACVAKACASLKKL